MLIMAKFATFITDSDLESQVIRAIHAIQGELLVRVVLEEQLSALSQDVVLISNQKISLRNRKLQVNLEMSFEELTNLLLSEYPADQICFDKGSSKVIAFVGLSGGVGTTTIAINYAFEAAINEAITLVDLDENFPEIAQNLSLHRIEDRAEKIGQNLQVLQGLPKVSKNEIFVMDIGSNHSHQVLKIADLLCVVVRLNNNTITRLQKSGLNPDLLICNFFERTKAQKLWLEKLQKEYPRLSIRTVTFDSRAFQMAAERKCALQEVIPNSLARKHIATLT